MRKDEDERIDDIFFDMMKMTKILYDSGQEKFHMHNKNFHDGLGDALEETNSLLTKKEKTVA